MSEQKENPIQGISQYIWINSSIDLGNLVLLVFQFYQTISRFRILPELRDMGFKLRLRHERNRSVLNYSSASLSKVRIKFIRNLNNKYIYNHHLNFFFKLSNKLEASILLTTGLRTQACPEINFFL